MQCPLALAKALVFFGLISCSANDASPQPKAPPPIVLSGVNYASNPTTDLDLDETDQRTLLATARSLCDGTTPPTPSDALQSLQRDIIVVFYDTEGKRATSGRFSGDRSTLNALTEGLPSLCTKANSDARIHLMVVGYNARLPNFGIKGVFDQKVFEPMVTGLVYEYRGKRRDIDPLLQLERNLGAKSIRNEIAWAVGLDPKQAPTANELIVEIYRVVHIGETRTTGAFSQFHRGHQRLHPSQINHELIEARLELIAEWYRNNVINGEVTYEYSTQSGQYRNSQRTMVRSTMSVWILNRLAEYLKQQDLKDLGQHTIEHYLDAYFQMDRSKASGKIYPSPVALENGNLVRNRWTSASFIAAAILERQDWEKQAKEVELLMQFAMGYKRDDGILWTENGSSQFFMPGQLLLAVAYAYDVTGNEVYAQFFDEVFDTYAPALMQLMHLGPKTVAPYAPAWYTQPAARMYQLTGNTKYRDLIYAINDRVVLNHKRNAAWQVYEDYDGMLAPKMGSYGNNSITAAALESLVDAAITAEKDGDVERFKAYRTAIRHAVAFLLRLQFTPDNAYYMEHPERIIGGFKKDMVSTVSWMDNVWHLSSAFMKIQEAELFKERIEP